MPLFPFTPVGVQDKLYELYLLPDTELALQADAIALDFRQWVKDSFSLSPYQMTFLDNMDNSAIGYYGEQCGLCFNNRLSITLIYPEPPVAPDYSKWPQASNTFR